MLMGEEEEQKGPGQETLSPQMPVLWRRSRRSPQVPLCALQKLTAGDQEAACSSLHSNTESIAAFFSV